jgi:murein DD-endopeptidase MepM/ murein hydrolase activator NlpD
MFGRPSRGLLDFVAAALCLWAAAYHTPLGALVRDLFAHVTHSHTATRPLLAYYSGGLYDTPEPLVPALPTALPDDSVLAAVPPGEALARGLYAVTSRLEGPARTGADTFAARYQGSLNTPSDAAQLLKAARRDLPSDEAVVLALFVGYDVASYAVARAQAEGRTHEGFQALVRQLPPTETPAISSASSVLQLGTAYALGWPVAQATRVSSPFGWREHPTLGKGQLHTGVDLAVALGTSVKAVAPGVVTRASEDDLNGQIVIIDHGFGVATAYCHNSRLLVRVGQRVQAGELISESGTTGRSTGPHLHYQLELGHRPVDPFNFRGTKPLEAPQGAPPRADL